MDIDVDEPVYAPVTFSIIYSDPTMICSVLRTPLAASTPVTSEQEQRRKSSAPKRSSPDEPTMPAAKRSKTKPKGEEPAFRDGFVPRANDKPNAKDYAPIPRALIIRSCADYSARILALNAFPDVSLQAQWAAETFRGACRSKGVRFVLTDRIAKLVCHFLFSILDLTNLLEITARGSQVRGKIIDVCRTQFASHFKFERSTAKKIIAQNQKKAADLVNNMSMHYKVRGSSSSLLPR